MKVLIAERDGSYSFDGIKKASTFKKGESFEVSDAQAVRAMKTDLFTDDLKKE